MKHTVNDWASAYDWMLEWYHAGLWFICYYKFEKRKERHMPR